MKFFDYPGGGVSSEHEQPSVLNDILEEDWNTIARFSNTINFKPNDILVNFGDRDDSVYIIVEGRLEVLNRGMFGAQKVVAEIAEGSVFGELSFFDQQTRIAAIKAVTSGSVIHLTRSGFENLSAWNPALGRKILLDLGKILAFRFRSIAPAGL